MDSDVLLQRLYGAPQFSNEVEPTQESVENAVVAINSWLKGHGFPEGSEISLATVDGQARTLSHIFNLISNTHKLTRDQSSLRDQTDKASRDYEQAKRNIRSLEDQVSQLKSKIGTLDAKLLKEQDAHKEEVKKLNDKLREKDKRALDDKRQIEALRRQVGGGRGATSTMRMEEDAGFNPQIMDLEKENRILKSQLQELRRASTAPGAAPSSGPQVVSRFHSGKAMRIPDGASGATLAEVQDPDQTPLSVQQQKELQKVAFDLRASVKSLEEVKGRLARQAKEAEDRASAAEARALQLKADSESLAARLQQAERQSQMSLARAQDAHDNEVRALREGLQAAQAALSSAQQAAAQYKAAGDAVSVRLVKAEERAVGAEGQVASLLKTVKAMGVAAQMQGGRASQAHAEGATPVDIQACLMSLAEEGNVLRNALADARAEVSALQMEVAELRAQGPPGTPICHGTAAFPRHPTQASAGAPAGVAQGMLSSTLALSPIGLPEPAAGGDDSPMVSPTPLQAAQAPQQQGVHSYYNSLWESKESPLRAASSDSAAAGSTLYGGGAGHSASATPQNNANTSTTCTGVFGPMQSPASAGAGAMFGAQAPDAWGGSGRGVFGGSGANCSSYSPAAAASQLGSGMKGMAMGSSSASGQRRSQSTSVALTRVQQMQQQQNMSFAFGGFDPSLAAYAPTPCASHTHSAGGAEAGLGGLAGEAPGSMGGSTSMGGSFTQAQGQGQGQGLSGRRTITPGRRQWDLPTQYTSPLDL